MTEINDLSYRQNIKEIAERAEHVTFNQNKIFDVLAIMKDNIDSQWWGPYRNTNLYYQLRPSFETDESAIMFNFFNMAQMFLIWEWVGENEVRPWHLYIGDDLYVGASSITAAHCRAISRGQNLLDPSYLAEMTLSDVADVYRDDQSGEVTLQNLPGRLAKFNEIGRVLRDEFEGNVIKLLERAGGYLYKPDGNGIVQLLAKCFPVSYEDKPFYKLANLFPLLLWNMRKSNPPRSTEFMRLTDFKDLDKIEGGADYYRPLFLLRVGIMEPDEKLRNHLSNRTLIPRNSQMEQEIRAHTLESIRALTGQIGEFPADLDGVEIETHAQAFLRCRHCRPGISDEELLCPYKPTCAAYNDDHELMKITWPLVETTAY